MKKLSRIVLTNSSSLLQKEEMLKIRGKGTYRCCCGMGSSVDCFDVSASSFNEASAKVGEFCSDGSYGGGGCFM